ncbi:histidine phosphatase family protein [Nocardia sp. NPDC050712]|uniref:histidine phosphatase family protein n=1 Tax=Nocardia sp. NPDC050712 TaxID=3155518 RepID=UPI00340425CF
MRTLYVIAHPESAHHVDGLVGGWYDSELTAGGLAAAAQIAEELRARIPDGAEVELFSSDLLRAQQAAEVIGARLGTVPVIDRALREKSYGVAEGKPQAWLRERFVTPPATGERLGHDEGIAGAETMGGLARRVYAAMDSILARGGEHQIIVTHGGTLTFVVGAFLGLPWETLGYARFRGPSGSITELREDDYFHNRELVGLGDTGHLRRE